MKFSTAILSALNSMPLVCLLGASFGLAQEPGPVFRSAAKGEKAIYEVGGSRAKNCNVVSAKAGSITVRNTNCNGLFIPGQIHRKIQWGDFALPEDSMTYSNQHGVLLESANPIAHLVVSEDGKQSAFVPFGFEGNVQLRPCGKLVLDASELNSKENHTVVIVWKNSLAGRFAFVEKQVSGDPEQPELDWRLHSFITVVTILDMADFKEQPEVYLPAGEVSISVVSESQRQAIKEFAAENLSQEFKCELAQAPATCGIHRIASGETTRLKLRTGTCLTGKVVSESGQLPDWNDLGFVGAHISLSDFWTSRLDWIPGYDVSRGVNHYVKTLQSETGTKARSRTLATTIAILKNDGRFMTLPMPEGNYKAHIYRPGQTIEMTRYASVTRMGTDSSTNPGIGTQPPVAVVSQVAVGLPLISSDLRDSAEPKSRPELVGARKAVHRGDITEAEQCIALARAAAGADASPLAESLNEAEQFVLRRKQLDRMFEDRDPNYNAQAASLLLDLAVSLIQHHDLSTPESIIQSARRISSGYTLEGVTPESITRLLLDEREKVLLGERPSPQPLSTTLTNKNVDEGFRDLGQFHVAEPAEIHEEPSTKFNPLQRLQNPKDSLEFTSNDEIDQRSILLDLQEMVAEGKSQSPDYHALVNNLRGELLEQFDQKVSLREKELQELKAKLESAEKNIRMRKANRTKIVEQHLMRQLKDFEQSARNSSD